MASRALRRGAAAMLWQPWRRRLPMARLRRLAMAQGALPVRTWQASSAKVTSRMWCSASMAQCLRSRSRGRPGWPVHGQHGRPVRLVLNLRRGRAQADLHAVPGRRHDLLHALVGIPLAYGVYETLIKASSLFTG